MGVARTVEDESRLRDKGSKGSSCEQPREGRTRRTGQERFSQRTQSGEHGESQATCSHIQPTQAPPEAAVKQASRAEARATTHGPLGMGHVWVLTALTGKDGDPQWERHPSLQGPPRAELGTVSVSLRLLLSSCLRNIFMMFPVQRSFSPFLSLLSKSLCFTSFLLLLLPLTYKYISLLADFWIRTSILIGSHSYCPLTVK